MKTSLNLLCAGVRFDGCQRRVRQTSAAFFQAVVENRNPEPGFEEALENQKGLVAVTDSIARNGWVEVD